MQTLILAVYFHDCIYNPSVYQKKGENELKSVDFFRKYFSENNSEVTELILSTINHRINEDIQNKEIRKINEIFLDLDLSVLGWTWPKYLLYC